MYPDEEYLDVDVQFGGVDQRKIFMFAREFLPKIGYRKRSYIMNSLIPGLGKSGKMSASEFNSKIDFHDSPTQIRKKIHEAYSVDGVLKDNGLLAILRHILFRYLIHLNRGLDVPRPERFGGPMKFNTMIETEEAFANGSLVSADLKPAVSNLLIEFLEPMRKFIEDSANVFNLAYPDRQIAIDKSRLFPLEIRVGKIVSWKPHLKSPSYTIYNIECGSLKFVVCSKYPVERTFKSAFDRKVLVIVNAASREIKGVKSTGHILFGSEFDVKSKTRKISPFLIPDSVEIATPVLWGECSEIIPKTEREVSVSKILKIVKTLKVDEHRCLTWKSKKLKAFMGGEKIKCDLKNSNVSI